MFECDQNSPIVPNSSIAYGIRQQLVYQRSIISLEIVKLTILLLIVPLYQAKSILDSLERLNVRDLFVKPRDKVTKLEIFSEGAVQGNCVQSR